MLGSVFGKTLFERRRGIAGWAAELVFIIVLIVAIYPSFAHVHALEQLAQSFPKSISAFLGYGGTIDYTSPVGFLGTELFTVTLPLLLLALAIGVGARAVAGEEEQATLDLLLANPLSRTRLLLEKAGALGAELLLLGLVMFAALAISTRAASVHIALGHLAAAAAYAVLLAVLFGAVALALGAATGKRGAAVGIASGAAAVAYLLNGVAPLVSWLEPLKWASPFFHYTEPAPLKNGFDVGHAALLLAPALVIVALGAWAFRRRDLS
jgi:ABC-2 type transport system permease protein